MSTRTQPISAERFAFAIQDLPVENLYAKAHELENSIGHLKRSNRSLQEYIDSIRSDANLLESTRQEGDKDCSDAIQENHIVIERQKERIQLLKQEVERRGARWHEADTSGNVNGSSAEASTNGDSAETERSARPRLTDEELRRQMMERLGDAEDGDEDDGLHL